MSLSRSKAKRSRTALLRKKRDSGGILTRLSPSRSPNLAMSRETVSYTAHLFRERMPVGVCLLNLGTSLLIYIFIYLLFSTGNIFFMATPPLVTAKAWLLGLLMITVMLDRGLRGGKLQPSGTCVPLPQPPPHPHLHLLVHQGIDVIGRDTPRPLDVMWINRAPRTEQETPQYVSAYGINKARLCSLRRASTNQTTSMKMKQIYHNNRLHNV